MQQYYLKSYEKPIGFQYAICLKADSIPIGYVHVSEHESHDFGYGLRKEFWNQGIMSEACRAVVAQIKEAGIPYITATHDSNNPHSGGVMKKIGMTYRYSYEEVVQPKNRLVTFRMYQLNLDGNTDRTYKEYWNKYKKHFVEKTNRIG